MEQTIVAQFETRRGAEMAVEHLVQKHGVNRSDVFVRAPGVANTSGVRAAGADAGKKGEPELAGPIEVSVDCHDESGEIVRSALREAGATQVRAR
ncbi:MAG: hypothetical protein KF889_18195 [Alphaproteobacteria bacterium]|nr:hypothetical protein [Alphaproteobacteria bacterium]MCW5744001.1 hypothetical protein [Alphaproteobacteria bacterium]